MAPPKKTSAKSTAKNKPVAKPSVKAAAPKAATKAVAPEPVVTKSPAAAPVTPPAPPPPVAVPTLPPEPIHISDKKAVEAYQGLYDELGELRWKLTDPDDIERIKEVRDQIYDVLSKLNKAQIADNTAAYAALQPDIDDCNQQLEEVQNDINTIVKNITIAANVTSAISRVIGIVTKV